MIAKCGNCKKKIKLGAKIEDGVRGLAPGKSIRVKCPECGEAVLLDSLMAGVSGKVRKTSIPPPSPPDISWLMEGTFDEDEVVEDIPLALVLMGNIPGRETVIKGIESIGYRVELVSSPEEAIEKMRFVNYASVILHSHYEGEKLPAGTFHKYMDSMHMSKRRYIFYILIGPEFNTFYDLQALAYSANLVVNDNEVSKFDVILRKAIPQYETLFGPIMEELRLHGK